MEAVPTDGRDEGCRPPTRSWASKTRWSYDDLHGMVNRFEDASLYISVPEGSVLISDTVRIGLEGRDEGIRVFKQFLRACGRVGIPTFCYDWMAASAGLALKSRSRATAARRSPVRRRGDARRTQGRRGRRKGEVQGGTRILPPRDRPGGRGRRRQTRGAPGDDPPHESVRRIPRNINSLDA